MNMLLTIGTIILAIVALVYYFISTRKGDYAKLKIGSILHLYGAVKDYTCIIFDIKHEPAARIDGSYRNIEYFIFIKEIKEFVCASKGDIIFDSTLSGKVALTNKRLGATKDMSFVVTNRRMSSNATKQLQQDYREWYEGRR